MNRIWKQYDVPFNDINRVIRGKIIPTVIGKLAFVQFLFINRS